MSYLDMLLRTKMALGCIAKPFVCLPSCFTSPTSLSVCVLNTIP